MLFGSASDAKLHDSTERVESYGPAGLDSFSVSERGVLVYGTEVGILSRLEWRDRDGRTVKQVGQISAYLDLSLSPDDKRLAVVQVDPENAAEADHMFTVLMGEKVGPRKDFIRAEATKARPEAISSAADDDRLAPAGISLARQACHSPATYPESRSMWAVLCT